MAKIPITVKKKRYYTWPRRGRSFKIARIIILNDQISQLAFDINGYQFLPSHKEGVFSGFFPTKSVLENKATGSWEVKFLILRGLIFC